MQVVRSYGREVGDEECRNYSSFQLKIQKFNTLNSQNFIHLQIVDGNTKTDVSNRRNPGQFCGEAEQPQTFISETSYVKVVFHTDNFTDQVSKTDKVINLNKLFRKNKSFDPFQTENPISINQNESQIKCRHETCGVI